MFQKVIRQIENEHEALRHTLRTYRTIRRALKGFDPKTMEFIWMTESIVRPLCKKGK